MPKPAEKEEKTTASASDHRNALFLVDGSGFIFRAYHALPPLTRPDGTPVGAVYGFVNILTKLLTEMGAPKLAVIFDAKRKNFRNDIYPEYKAHRPDPPEDLVPQFAIIREAVEAFNLPCIEMEGFEADDLIATYARLAQEAGQDVVIVSSDKDLMQLVRPGVAMMDPLKYKMLGRQDVIDKFGVPPEKVVEVQALAGDSTDNVPGVPGIGIKTAAQLIEEYGDLETLLARAGEIKQQKRRETLIENAELARISRRLVALDDNVKVTVPLEQLSLHKPDHQRLLDFLKTQGFRTTITRLEKVFFGTESAPAEKPAMPPSIQAQGYELVTDEAHLKKWIARAFDAGVIAVDTETTGLTPAKVKLVGVSMSTEAGNGCYIPLGHSGGDMLSEAPKQMDMATAMALLKPLLEDPSVLKVAHNAKYDMQMFFHSGIRVAPLDDTMLISYVLDGASHGHGMDELAQLHLGYNTIKYLDVVGKGKAQVTFDQITPEVARDYAAEDADITLRLHKLLKPRLAAEKMTSVYETLERPLIPVIADMEFTGIKIDPATLQKMSREFEIRLAELEKDIHKLAGNTFNVGSPKQLGEILFEQMGIQGGSKTKTGAWSTSADILEELATQGHVIVERVLEWRQLSKLKSTYTDALPEAINPATGRVHTSFAMALTNTGRLSSSDPNLQNIPIRTEEGRKIRTAFIAAPGCVLLSIDYSQVELRLLAELGKIPALHDAFASGIDIHAHTASQVFNVPLDQMTSEIRRQAKAINFGIIYGISAFGLAKQLGIPNGEAGKYIQQYLARFPELTKYMDDMKAFAREHGYVKTFFGRKCFMPGIKDKNPSVRNFAERQAINAPLQGTAADLMKRAMIRIPPALVKAGLKAKMLLQVHDELVFEVPENEIEKTSALIKDIMERAGEGLGVPLVADAGFGPNWDEAH